MRRPTFGSLTLATFVSLGLTLGHSACGGADTTESLTRQQLSLMQEFTGTLAKITDKASAEQHKGTLDATVARMAALKQKLDSLPKDQQGPSAELMQKLQPELEATTQKFMKEMMRVATNQEAQGVLESVLQKMPR